MIVRKWIAGVVAAAAALGGITALAEQASGPYENIKAAPVAVTWQYSNDDGKTFADKAFPGPPPGHDPRHTKDSYLYVWKGTFDVPDPAKIAGLWIRMIDTNADSRATICNGDIWAASGGFWKDLGFCPTLLNASIKFNEKEVPFPHGGPLLQFWAPLTGEVQKGKNTVELRGNVYTFWQASPSPVLDAKVLAAEPQPANLVHGPVLGDFGENYFTLACRAQLPSELIVEATPTEPAGPAVKAVSSGKIFHRPKIEVPAGTRKLSYTLTCKVGTHETKQGPYTVAMPRMKEYRFIAFGHPQQQLALPDVAKDPWHISSQIVLKAKPDFVVNTGNLMEQGSWSFWYQSGYFTPAAELLARMPGFVTPCEDDFTGTFDEAYVTPGMDTYMHSWTKVVGPVLFIGIDGIHDWSAGGQNARWLEEVLAASKDKFIVALCGYPGYSSGINSKYCRPPRVNIRDVVLPLLGKYKATLMLSSWDPTYERIDLPADKGVTQIITGCTGRGSWHRWDTRMGSHPFVPTNGNARGTVGRVPYGDGREWVGYFSTRNMVVFDVKEDAIEMKALNIGGDVNADIDSMKVLDQKTFKPRM